MGPILALGDKIVPADFDGMLRRTSRYIARPRGIGTLE